MVLSLDLMFLEKLEKLEKKKIEENQKKNGNALGAIASIWFAKFSL